MFWSDPVGRGTGRRRLAGQVGQLFWKGEKTRAGGALHLLETDNAELFPGMGVRGEALAMEEELS